jgi:hypothetical protein
LLTTLVLTATAFGQDTATDAKDAKEPKEPPFEIFAGWYFTSAKR